LSEFSGCVINRKADRDPTVPFQPLMGLNL